jgi:hypothetical protein
LEFDVVLETQYCEDQVRMDVLHVEVWGLEARALVLWGLQVRELDVFFFLFPQEQEDALNLLARGAYGSGNGDDGSVDNEAFLIYGERGGETMGGGKNDEGGEEKKFFVLCMGEEKIG